MADPKPEPPESGGGYRSNWLKWLLIYVVVGGAVYALVYFIFFSNGGYGS